MPLDQPRIGEARADGAVEDVHRPAEGAVRLAHDERRAGHAFGAAGQVQPALAAGDRPRRVDHRRQAAGAQAVDRLPRHPPRQTGSEQGITRQVAAVLAGLVGAAEDHILQVVDSEAGGLHDPRQQRADQVVRTHPGQGAGVAAERSAQAGIDIGIEHDEVLAGKGGWSGRQRVFRLAQGNAQAGAAAQPGARAVAWVAG
ncbi:hypothetical protein D3C76_466930 [compost metagenome]